MEDDQKYFYAKFKMNSKMKIAENMIISESKPTIDEWKGTHARNTVKENLKEEETISHFRLVMRDFEDSINTFKTTVPFIMKYAHDTQDY
jgi:hypothetical protein